jgi:hypothetical protein
MPEEITDTEEPVEPEWPEQPEPEWQAQEWLPEPGYEPSADPTVRAYQEAMEQGDYRTALGIQAALMQASVQRADAQRQQFADEQAELGAWADNAEQAAIRAVGDADEWEQYKEKVAEEAMYENFEGLSALAAGNKLARLHKMVKADTAAEAERQAKLRAQTMAGSSGRPPQSTREQAEAAAIVRVAHEGSYERLIRG